MNVEEGELQGRTAFFFRRCGRVTKVVRRKRVVVQGDDFWLYVLRIRTVGGDAIPTLMRDVGATFAFNE